MKIGDLVECKLEIYGLGLVLSIEPRIDYDGRITIQWFDPPRWCMPDGNISTHKPSNLEVVQ